MKDSRTQGALVALAAAMLLLHSAYVAGADSENEGRVSQDGLLDRLLAPYDIEAPPQAVQIQEDGSVSPCPSVEVSADELRREYPDCMPSSELLTASEVIAPGRSLSVNQPGRQPGLNIYTAPGSGGQVDLIREVQIELLNRGYYDGDTDGLVGAETRAAVKAFQNDAGLIVDGRIDAQLLGQLERRAFVQQSYFSMAAGRSPSVIGNVQLALSRAGYYRGPVDGILNPATRDAIQQYRQAPYEQVFVDGFPREYPYLSPVAEEILPHVPFESYPGQVDADIRPGYPELTAGDYAAAIEQATVAIRATQANPTISASAFFVRGVAYLYTGENAEASLDFTSVLRIDPNNAAAYFNRAIAYQRNNLPEFSRRDYRRALDMAPDLLNSDSERNSLARLE